MKHRRVTTLILLALVIILVGSLLLVTGEVLAGNWSLILRPGERVKIGCPSPLSIYAIPEGDSWLVVGCHD